MNRIRISHKRCECVGCGFCIETAPDYWFMNARGEAQLHTIQSTRQRFECAEGFAPDAAALTTAEAGCPVNVIRIG